MSGAFGLASQREHKDGELTTSPTALVDSEGEEMSFNKVDKALQSVGISMKDANGQFRDFDDVILDLSKKWQTLDKNTQRYEHHCVSNF